MNLTDLVFFHSSSHAGCPTGNVMSEAVYATSGLNAPVSTQTSVSTCSSSPSSTTESVDSQTPLLTKSWMNNTSTQVAAKVSGVNIPEVKLLLLINVQFSM